MEYGVQRRGLGQGATLNFEWLFISMLALCCIGGLAKVPGVTWDWPQIPYGLYWISGKDNE